MIADSAARLRALDVSQSFIVQAPAGSGKTELLIQRYLKLLETLETPDAVIAITFTRKAAGEMRTRVMEALRAAESGIEPTAEHERLTFQISRIVLQHERKLGWNLLRNPARLRIETIDALCAAITRRMPWLARFGAMPEISEKAEDLYREAARNTLRHLEQGHQGVAYLLLHLDNDFQRASHLIGQMLEKRDQWLRHTGANLRDEIEASLQRLILHELAQLKDAFEESMAAEITCLRELECFPEACLEDLENWKKIVDLLLTKGGDLRQRVDISIGFPPGHPHKLRCENLLSSLRGDDGLLERLRRFRELPEPRFSATQWQAVEAAVSVLTLAVAELQLVFRDRRRVDFAELAIRASAALGRVEEPEDLALALGSRIQHLLVDEFQDTSYTQFELIEKLTAGWEAGDGRTLFLVGDPMQSIYRFRQADVSLFLKARLEGIAGIQLEPLTLSVNFRSRPAIVEWVNRTFASILPERDDLESGAVAYSPSIPGAIATDAVIDMQAPLGLHAHLDQKQEADRVVELAGAYAGGSVGVLVRSRSHLIEIVNSLKQRRIPFQAIEIDQLGERQVVEDLMALTFALLHAADRVSWLAILRAPWCGLALEDLHAVAGADHRANIWDLLLRKEVALTGDGRARIHRILPVMEQAMAERGRQPLRDWVESTWLQLGGPACVADETALQDAAAYFDLLEGHAEGADLSDFEWFREQVNALFALPSAHGEGLQLMTIHKAKGLEFDTVILPGLGATTRSEDQRLLVWLEHQGELLLAPIAESGGDKDAIYSYLTGIEARKSEQETARLLYVAATRARHSLHLLATVKLKDNGAVSEPESRSLLKLLWPSLAEQFGNPTKGDAGDQTPGVRTLRRLPAAWHAPAAPPPVEWEHAQTQRLARAEAAFDWVTDQSRHTGEALHLFLQRIAREGLEAWDEATVRSRRSSYQAVLANLGVPPRDLPGAAERIESGLLRTLRDPRGRWVLQRHSDAANEFPIAGLIDGSLCEAVIDRSFIDEDGVRWIVDYKTSSPDGKDLETFLEQEKERFRDQLERYASLMVQRDKPAGGHPIRLGIYFPLCGAWLEWAAPTAFRRQALLFNL